MRLRRGLGALALVICAGPLAAGQKTYAGEEAAALRCANTLAFTAVALESSGGIGQLEKDVMLDITVRILVDHVSGTWRQKKAALRIVRDRRDVIETLDDFRRYANQCLVQFPIN
ncbi:MULTISPECIES: hypothetical protein [unclassified Roseobacter]|uniref:hypothetical protein n=1 Tax=unclassified Roseobacter TaxID=196798 RepID=UPI001E35015D|nr:MULTISPECIES: hypothetical protein [unclassified Roseobacter]MDW3181256.1 hypothetical protein [Roseobacter sp.]